MQRIELNKNWKVSERIFAADFAIPADAADVNLPIDLLTNKARDYTLPHGEYNSYYAPMTAVFTKTLPQLKNYARIILDLWGVNTSCDVYVNDVYLTAVENTAHNYIELTHFLFCGLKNRIKLVVCSPTETGKYTGAGVSGGAALLVTESQAGFGVDGVYVRTEKIDEFAHLTVSAEAYNNFGDAKNLTLEAIILNARGKKVVRKIRKIKLAPNTGKTYEIPVKLTRHHDYSTQEPYLYSCAVSLYEGETKLDAVTVPFGILQIAVSTKGLQLNNRPVKLMGAVMAHDNGLLGNCSVPEAERYKLSKVKRIGYNAVRYSGIPSDAALDALDGLGLYAVIDLYDVWAQGEFPYDGHRTFNRDVFAATESMVKTLRKHPSVILYCLGNRLTECYGRDGGAGTARMLTEEVKKLDDSRPVTINARELTPLRQEAAAAGGAATVEGDNLQGATEFARAADLFGKLTAPVFAEVDVAGYSYLYTRYDLDKTTLNKPIIGLATVPDRAFEAWEEACRHAHVLGDFQFTGADFLGRAVGVPACGAEGNLFPLNASCCGDLDLTYRRKAQSYYREILAGNKSVLHITVQNWQGAQEDSGGVQINAQANAVHSRLPVGREAVVSVVSGGEVVALYHNGRLVGRKLAGKANLYTATFKTESASGRLEAVSFNRGAECARCVLEPSSAPRTIQLKCAQKSISVGELSFVEISVLDAAGSLVTQSDSEIEVAVTGEGKQIAFGNGDPASQILPSGAVCPVFNGKALLVVRGLREGQVLVKAVSDGLLSAKTAVRVHF